MLACICVGVPSYDKTHAQQSYMDQSTELKMLPARLTNRYPINPLPAAVLHGLCVTRRSLTSTKPSAVNHKSHIITEAKTNPTRRAQQLPTKLAQVVNLRLMAETIAVAASAAGIISLADVACRLASTLFSFFGAVKNAPGNVQNLVKELQLLQFVLADVREYVTRLESTRGVQLNISNDCLHSVLRECQSKLEALMNISMSVQDPNRDNGRVSRRLKWVLEEKKTKEHLAMVARLKLDLLIALLVAGKYVMH